MRWISLFVIAATFAAAPFVFSDDRTASQVDKDIAASKTITEITLVRSGSTTGGPKDVLTLRNDGTFRYVGKENVDRIGTFSGNISKHYFGDVFPKLAETYIMLRRRGLSSGKPTGNVTAVTIQVVRNGKTEDFTNWCPGLDRELFTLEMAIRGIVADVAWKPDLAK